MRCQNIIRGITFSAAKMIPKLFGVISSRDYVRFQIWSSQEWLVYQIITGKIFNLNILGLQKSRINHLCEIFNPIFSHKLEYRTTQMDSQVEQVIEEIDNESEASDADYVEEVPESTPVRPKKKSKKVRIQAPKKSKKAKYALSSESSEAVISDDESSPDSDFDW